jgi:hypothetical protein
VTGGRCNAAGGPCEAGEKATTNPVVDRRRSGDRPPRFYRRPCATFRRRGTRLTTTPAAHTCTARTTSYTNSTHRGQQSLSPYIQPARRSRQRVECLPQLWVCSPSAQRRLGRRLATLCACCVRSARNWKIPWLIVLSQLPRKRSRRCPWGTFWAIKVCAFCPATTAL